MIITKVKYIVSGLIIFVVVYIGYDLYWRYNFTGDVYRYSENYIINLSSQKAISNINTFKEMNPEYRLRRTDDNYSPKHYHVYFYFKDINLTIQCLVDPIDNDKSIISLYAVSKGTNFASWQSVNTKDLTKEENKHIKRKFETEILDKLGDWKHDRWFGLF